MLTRITFEGRIVHPMATVPFGLLYLTALNSRLISTCFSRVRSALTTCGISNCGKDIAMPRFLACGSIMARHSSMISASDTGSRDSDSLPDSISARSSISLINSSRYQPALSIWSMLRFCEGVGSGVPDSISCANPSMAFSGVRSSWLMLDRKSDLARLAFSAASIARVSSDSTRLRTELSVPINR